MRRRKSVSLPKDDGLVPTWVQTSSGLKRELVTPEQRSAKARAMMRLVDGERWRGTDYYWRNDPDYFAAERVKKKSRQ